MTCLTVEECVRVNMKIKALTKQDAESRAFKALPSEFDDYIPVGLDAKLKCKNEWFVTIFLKVSHG